MLELGTTAPGFTLPNYNPLVARKEVTLEPGIAGRGVLVAFICNHCPYVILIADTFSKFADEYMARGLEVIAINPNDVEAYPQDHPDRMAEFARKQQFHFPYLLDITQSVAKAYSAACTPDLYLFNPELELVYRGQFDGARPGNGIEPDGQDLRSATDDLLDGRTVGLKQLPSMGCNIKWRPGNEPV